MIRFLKPTSITCASILAIGLGASQALSAVNIDFDTAASYDNNFWETGSGTSSMTWDSEGYVAKGRPTGQETNASNAIYNSTVTGGTGGNGGTTAGSQLDTFSNYRLEADVSFSAFGSPSSFGFLTGLNNAGAGGSLLIVRLGPASPDTRDVRYYEGANPTNSGVGDLTERTALTSDTTFTVDTVYTIRLDVETDGNSITYTTSILDLQGNLLADSIVFTENDPVRTEGQVGFRLGTPNAGDETRLHRYSVTVIPEPSTYALMGGVLALGLAVFHRRRKQ